MSGERVTTSGLPIRLVASTEPRSRWDAATEAVRWQKAGDRHLRLFIPSDQQEVGAFRLSAIFEMFPDLDPPVIGLLSKGYRHLRDLDGLAVAEVFSGVSATFEEQRAILDELHHAVGFELRP